MALNEATLRKLHKAKIITLALDYHYLVTLSSINDIKNGSVWIEEVWSGSNKTSEH